MAATHPGPHGTWRRGGRFLFVVGMCIAVMSPSALVEAPAIRALAGPPDNRYSGMGGIVLPASESLAIRIDAAHCPGCRWRYATPCTRGPRAPDVLCRQRGTECGADELRRLWRADVGRPWREHGLVCVSPTGPMSVERAWELLTSQAAHGLPVLRPSCFPASGVVQHLPVRCSSGQPPHPHAVRIEEGGVSISAAFTPEWHWELRHAGTLLTRPGDAAAHVVRLVLDRSGPWLVTVRTVWRGRLSISGVPVATGGVPVVQRASASVRVGLARSRLRPSGTSPRRPGADVRTVVVPWQTTRTKARPSDIA